MLSEKNKGKPYKCKVKRIKGSHANAKWHKYHKFHIKILDITLFTIAFHSRHLP